MPFDRDVALVTGSTSGIGAATAALLASRGAHVIVTGRSAERGERVVASIREQGGKADLLVQSLDDADDAKVLAGRSVEIAGRVDILVNNAAIARFGNTPAMTEADFDDSYSVNVKVPYFLVASLAPPMVERGRGAIVNVSTMVAGFGTVGSSVYASSKAAMNALTRCWAAEFGPYGVRVNAVAPGPTHTEGTHAEYGVEALERLASRAPARRAADPMEIARAVVYLAGDESSFVHGVVLDVDGGRSSV